MKTQFYLIPLLFFLFVACSGDDDSSKQETQKELDVTVANLEGAWLAIEYSENSGFDFEPYISIDEDEQYTYTFKSDSSFLNTSNLQCNGFFEINQESKKLILNFEEGCIAESSSSTVLSLTSSIMILLRPAGDEAVKIKYNKQIN